MLLLVEVLHAGARLLVAAELRLVLLRVEVRLRVPLDSALELVDWGDGVSVNGVRFERREVRSDEPNKDTRRGVWR